jgi:uncharacterized protein (DUF2336 family)
MGTAGTLIAELEDAIQGNFADKRAVLLRRVTDLFVRGADAFTEDHVAVFDDVLVRLAAGMELRARAELSDRLAPIANAPIRTVEALSTDDEVTVAGPVLAQSERLADANLVDIIHSKSQGHMLAISTRPSIDPVVTDALVEVGNREVARTVAKNAGARFSNAGFGMLVGRSRADELLAEAVGTRRDLPRRHFEKLVASASAAVRNRIADATPALSDDIRNILAAIPEEIYGAANQPRDYAAARNTIKLLCAANKLGESAVASFAKQGRFEETAVAVATVCDVPLEAVERAFYNPDWEPTVILVKATGFAWETAKCLLELCVGGAQVPAEDLANAKAHFDTLQIGTAQRVLRLYKVRQANVMER